MSRGQHRTPSRRLHRTLSRGQHRMGRRVTLARGSVLKSLLLTIAFVFTLVGGGAWAYWNASSGPGGNGASKASTVNGAATPTASLAGSAVTISWAASTLSNGNAVAGYVVKRYDAVTPFAPQTILSACTGKVTSTTCAENNVPTGSWVYSVTPVFATNWTGSESLLSNVVVMPGIAAKLAFTTNPSGSTVSTTFFAIQPVITVQDAGGNTVTGSSTSVTLSITGSPAGANLTCSNNSRNASSGVATFSSCKVDKAGTYTLTAIASGLTSAVSASFTIQVGPAAQLGFTRDPSSSTDGGVAFSNQPRVAVQDAGGNTVTSGISSSTSVTLSITGSPAGANLTCSNNSRNASSGVATFSSCKVDKAGTYTLTASASGLTSAVSASFTITVGSATQLGFTTDPSSSTNGGVAFSTQPVVTVQDLGGNTVTSGRSVTLSITGSPGGVNLSCSQNPLNASSGVATFSGCTIDKAGTYTLTATASGPISGTSSSFTITSSCATPGVQTLFSSEDSTLKQAAQGQNFGTDKDLFVDPTSGAAMRAVVKFDLSKLGAGCTVTAATLQLNIKSGSGPSIDVFLADRYWTEAAVKWSSNVGTTGTAANSAAVSGSQTWAVGALVQAQYTGTNNGLVVRNHLETGGGSGPIYYAHEQGPSFAPKLIVTLG
jgi:trimeric autotransporter adhesin